MSNNKNTFRAIYGGTMIVLNDSERFALCSYFYRRGIDLSAKFIRVFGETYYEISKVEMKTLDHHKKIIAA